MSTPTLLELCDKATPGPYFVSHDDKRLDRGEYYAHVNSGLAVVDTGRSQDWPIGRFMEWPNAQLIARMSPEVCRRLYEFLETMERYVKASTYPDGPCLAHEDHKEACALLALLDGKDTPQDGK